MQRTSGRGGGGGSRTCGGVRSHTGGGGDPCTGGGAPCVHDYSQCYLPTSISDCFVDKK